MSKMSDIFVDIESMLADGVSAIDIAQRLNVPLEWVLDAQERFYMDDTL